MGTIRRALGIVVAAALAAGIWAPTASAGSTTWFNTDPIVLKDVTNSTPPAPSIIQINGQRGPITDVDVFINGIDLASLGELQLLLRSPAGESEVVMSFNCSDENVSDRFITFDQSAQTEMPAYDGGACPLDSYKPSFGHPSNSFFGLPGGPPYTHNFDNFDNENANGTWSLYAFKNCGGAPCVATDQIEAGWSVRIETGPWDLDLPAGSATSGPASPYPSTRTVSGRSGLITDVNVRLDGVFHTHPADMELMLEGPNGQRVMLMSDACGGYDVNAYGWTWDDQASGSMPFSNDTNVCGAPAYRPTDLIPGDSLPAPAPQAPYANSLSAFDLTDPNGEWRLWVADDGGGDEGFFTNRFDLQFTTRPRAVTAFSEAAVEAAEGTTKTLTVGRSGANAYAAATVDLATSPGTAVAGDFTPVSQTLQFAAGQTEKTVEIAVPADEEQEGAETFTVSLSSPAGDAALGSPTTATVTIPANAGGPAPLPDPDPGSGSGGGQADSTPPQTSIDRAPAKRTEKHKAKLGFSADEPGSFECKLDKAAYEPCSSPAKLKRLRRGGHRFQVRAIDAAGNADPTPAKVRWKVIGS